VEPEHDTEVRKGLEPGDRLRVEALGIEPDDRFDRTPIIVYGVEPTPDDRPDRLESGHGDEATKAATTRASSSPQSSGQKCPPPSIVRRGWPFAPTIPA